MKFNGIFKSLVSTRELQFYQLQCKSKQTIHDYFLCVLLALGRFTIYLLKGHFSDRLVEMFAHYDGFLSEIIL